MSRPDLSLVVTLQEPGAVACLESVFAATAAAAAEVEVVAVGDAKELAGLRRHFPRLETVAAAPAESSLPTLQALGIARSRGARIGLTEAPCRLAPDWVEAALAAAEGAPGPVVGGAMEPASGLGVLDRALFLCDELPFLRPFEAGPASELPGNNIVFRGEVARAAVGRPAAGFWKSFLLADLLAAGTVVWRDPRPVVTLARSPGFARTVRRRWRHGRCFGAMRAARLTAGRRLVYALAGPVLPAVVAARLAAGARRKLRGRPDLTVALPFTLLWVGWWMAGELVGNLGGAGRSCAEL